MTAIIITAWFVIGIYQLISGIDGLEYWLNASFLGALLLSGAIALFFPPASAILCFFTAWRLWEWPWWGAALFAVPGLALFPAIFVADAWKNRRKRA